MLGGPGSRDLTQRHAWPEHLLHGMGQACSQPPPSLQEDLPPSPILATGSGDLAHGWQLLGGPLQAHMRKSLEPSSGWGGALTVQGPRGTREAGLSPSSRGREGWPCSPHAQAPRQCTPAPRKVSARRAHAL